ncbi:hypothetical protein OAP56_04480 [Rickettsiaceae bacterium]|nr:hypothetical protein [Rickettsiaceae bacterium]
MGSKELDSILGNTPPATVGDEKKNYTTLKKREETEEVVKIVARVPLSLKNDIREYIKNNKNETESTLVTKGLKKMGFSIDDKWVIDRRKLR